MIDTWYHSEIAYNTLYRGALSAIAARAMIMPSTTDLYFTLADSEAETKLMPNAGLRRIPSFTQAVEKNSTPRLRPVLAQLAARARGARGEHPSPGPRA